MVKIRERLGTAMVRYLSNDSWFCRTGHWRTENGRTTLQGWTLQEWKMTEEVAGVVTAGLEWKMQDWNLAADWKMTDWQLVGRTMMECTCSNDERIPREGVRIRFRKWRVVAACCEQRCHRAWSLAVRQAVDAHADALYSPASTPTSTTMTMTAVVIEFYQPVGHLVSSSTATVTQPRCSEVCLLAPVEVFLPWCRAATQTFVKIVPRRVADMGANCPPFRADIHTVMHVFS